MNGEKDSNCEKRYRRPVKSLPYPMIRETTPPGSSTYVCTLYRGYVVDKPGWNREQKDAARKYAEMSPVLSLNASPVIGAEVPGNNPTFGRVFERVQELENRCGEQERRVRNVLVNLAAQMTCPASLRMRFKTQMRRFFDWCRDEVDEHGFCPAIQSVEWPKPGVDCRSVEGRRVLEFIQRIEETWLGFMPMRRDFQIHGVLEFFEAYRYTSIIELDSMSEYEILERAADEVRYIAFDLARDTRLNNTQLKRLMEVCREQVEGAEKMNLPGLKRIDQALLDEFGPLCGDEDPDKDRLPPGFDPEDPKTWVTTRVYYQSA